WWGRRSAPPLLLSLPPPAGTSWPAPGTPVRESDPAHPWAGRGRARGRRAGTAGGGSGPVCSALPVRLGIRRSEAHTAAVVDAGGDGRHADGDGTPAQAGASIDSGGRCMVFGVVAGTGRCGGQGGGRICIRRQRGAQGSGRSIQDETR
ncbi:hypothetical protein B0H13DRAFT_2091824, partial [Mycena leptocephala]